MRNLEETTEGSNVPFLDMLFNITLGLVAVVLILLAHLNPPEEETDSPPPGELMARIEWRNVNSDVDLWVRGPDGASVGFSNPGGPLWNLLRDDTGANDISNRNEEFAYTRGIAPGEYIINVHCFRCPTFWMPLTVRVEIILRPDQNTSGKPVAVSEVSLEWAGQEKTALRFEVNEDHELVEDSLNHEFKSIYIAQDPRGGRR